MSGTLRNLRATASAEVSNLEQGMKRAAQATRQVGVAAEETSRRGSRAMFDFSHRSEVGLRELAKSSREVVTGLLDLSNAAGETGREIGGLVSTMISGFAGGGPMGLGIAAIAGAISILGAESRKAREEQEKLRREQERAAEQAKQEAERAAGGREAEGPAAPADPGRDPAPERPHATPRSAPSRTGSRSGRPRRRAPSTPRSSRSARPPRRAGAAGRRTRTRRRPPRSACGRRPRRGRSAERKAAEAQRDLTRSLVEQARREFDVLTLTSEQLEAKRRAKLIQDLITQGKKDEAEAIRQAIEYEKQVKAKGEKAKEEKRAAEEARREEERRADARRKLADAAGDEVDKLRSERALLAAGTDELRKREERRQREIELIKEYGAEAMKVIQEQRRFWAEEDAHAAKKRADEARAAKAKASPRGQGRGPRPPRREREPRRGEPRRGAPGPPRRHAPPEAPARRDRPAAWAARSTTASFSGLGGIRSGRRLDQRGPFSSFYGGAGDMDHGRDGEGNIQPGLRQPPGRPGKDDQLHPPGWPGSIPVITPGDGGRAAGRARTGPPTPRRRSRTRPPPRRRPPTPWASSPRRRRRRPTGRSRPPTPRRTSRAR